MRRALLLSLLLLAGCRRTQPLRVGAKPFAESRILGEVFRQLALQAGRDVAPLETCADSWDCQHRLQSGALHLMVDYTGTGLALLGADIRRGEEVQQVRELYAPLGVSWLEPLGFDNGYRVLVPSWRADGLEAISELPSPLVVTCPPEFVRRPADGLAPMLRRYGLALEGEPLVIADPTERYRALLDGRADVAIGYATDGALAGQPLVSLRDDLDFFPAYLAAPVANTAQLAERPGAEKAAALVAGRLDEAAMQALNYKVEVQGYEPAEVARGWLKEQGLLDAEAAGERVATIGLAYDPDDGLRAMVDQALRASRAAIPDQPVREIAGDPLEALSGGEARLAVVGAERFFRRTRRGEVVRDPRAAAVAVLGTRAVHLLRPPGADGAPETLGVVGGAAEAAALLWEDRPKLKTYRDAEALLRAARDGALDAALVLAVPGDPALAGALEGLALQAVPAPGGTDLAWLRPARIPAGTYPGQRAAVDTLSAQVVLAGATAERTLTAAGPVSSLPSSGRPLAPSEVEALAAAVGTLELPDPVLPSAADSPSIEPPDTAATEALDTALNLLVLAFLGWLVTLALARGGETSGEMR